MQQSWAIIGGGIGMRSKKTRRAIRQLAREAQNRAKHPDAPLTPPNGIPVDGPGAGSSAIPTAELVEEGLENASTRLDKPGVPLSQAETAALPSIPRTRPEDPNAETEGGTAPPATSDAPQEPPLRIPFSCPCGTFLTAPKELYDKRMRCNSCGEILLLTLLYKADLQRFEIYPLRATPES
jgi:hypothetical protein